MQDGANSGSKQAVLLPATAACACGATAIIGQIVCMREMMAAFNGNELSLGVVLATWLIWTSAGSGWGGRLFRSVGNVRSSAGIVGCLCGFSLPATVAAIRASRALLQSVPGEELGPVSMALTSVICLSLFCLLSGCIFVLAARFYSDAAGTMQSLAVSFAYLFETLGAAAGGILTSIFLLRVFSPFQIVTVVAVMDVCLAMLLMTRARWRTPAIVGAIVAGAALIAYVAPSVERSTEQRLWPGLHVVALRDSVYGRMSVLRLGETFSLYENGGIVANVPDPATAEETVHYALLEHPGPQRILMIGGGLNGSIVEALRHPTVQHIDYVELDPALIAIGKKVGVKLSDPRIQVHLLDGRLYLNSTDELFDVIIVSTPDPDNAQLNRFYTTEFFGLARKHLASGGIVAIQLRSSEEAISPEMAEFQRCIYATLREQFPYTAIIPGETLHLFAAQDAGILTEEPKVLLSRLRSRHIESTYVREYFLPFRMAPERMEQMKKILQLRPDTARNHDMHPVAYYFATILWTAQVDSTYVHWLKIGSQIRMSGLISGLTFLSLVVAVWATRVHGAWRIATGWSIIATGYTLMALEILSLLSFQSAFGYVYQGLAMLVGAMMAGIGLGSWLGIKTVRSENHIMLMNRAAANQLVLSASAPFLLMIVGILSRNLHGTSGNLVALIVFPVLAFLAGIPGGFQFPVASAIYQGSRAHQSGPGMVYALDLIGGCCGASVLTAFLIPLFGFWSTAWLASVIAAGPALAVLACLRLRSQL